MPENKPALDRVRVAGPLASFADGFAECLIEQGYSLWTVQHQLQLVAHASRWMDGVGLDVAGLTPAAVERFLAERRRAGYATKVGPGVLRPLIGYLDSLRVLPAVAGAVPTAVDELLEAFCRYLLIERGLVSGSVALYAPVARVFLEERSEPLCEDLARLSGAEVKAFVLRQASRRGVRSAETMVCALRALLRFLHVQGWVAAPLAGAVPSIARRREDLPRGLPAGQVALLLASCDRTTTLGRRDFAILTLLARLGLRAGEVAAMQLGDVDWRAGEIQIRGKGSRIDRLPLPVDVGEAIVDYLRHGRPRGYGRTLFLRSCAPLTGLSNRGISAVVVSACGRAGIEPVRAHRLRHSVACELLRRGAGLTEIGQVLRHQRAQTTSVYAKVDRSALSRLALPWPGGES
ncbi:MAG: site-specific integrase [Actinomycetota bacterium]|nr:site-specific integrase [Actinomycetota bacterium]